MISNIQQNWDRIRAPESAGGFDHEDRRLIKKAFHFGIHSTDMAFILDVLATEGPEVANDHLMMLDTAVEATKLRWYHRWVPLDGVTNRDARAEMAKDYLGGFEDIPCEQFARSAQLDGSALWSIGHASPRGWPEQ